MSASSFPLVSIDGFHIIRLIGRGGFAAVYLAQPTGNQHAAHVALKVAHQPGDPRMTREAEALRRLGPPVTPALLKHGKTHDGRPFLAMEYLGEDSLARRMAERAAIALDQLAPWFLAVCEAVERTHAAGIVHRDLKPANIMFRPDGRAAIIDFGLAQLAARALASIPNDLTRTNEWMGTHPYMAPEQWHSSRDTDTRTDIYSLGVIAFELLTGRRPFEGDTAAIRAAHVSRRCPAPSELAPPWATDPEIDREPIDSTVLSCLAKNKAERFTRAADLEASFRLALQRRAAPGALAATTAPAPASQPVGELQHMPAQERPIVLLSVCTEAPAPQASAVAAAHDAVIAHAEAERYVLAFPWEHSIHRAVRVAVRVADAMQRDCGLTGPAVIHLAPITARTGKRGLRLLGQALTASHTWAVPSIDIRGVLLTSDMAQAIGRNTLTPAGSGYYQLPQKRREGIAIDPERIPLYGRANIVQALIAELETCISSRIPLLSTIEGDIGLGKTRILHALALESRTLEPHRVVYARARQALDQEPEALYCELARHALGLGSGPVSSISIDDLDRAWARLGASPDDAERWAAAFLLGAAPRGIPELEPILRAPGALRQAASRALATALVHAAAAQPLMLLLDDMHAADHTTLDALERATMEAEKPRALGIWVATRPSLFSRRPRWGDRALAGQRHILAPLERHDAQAMLTELLRPMELVPEPVLDRLHQIAGGIPLYLAELACAARERSIYQLATDKLAVATNVPIVDHLARQLLDSLPAPLIPLAQLCALIGPEFTREDISGIQTALHHTQEYFDIDPAFGLSRLCHADFLKQTAQGYALRLPLMGQAIVALIPRQRRIAFHAAVLRNWQARKRIHEPAPQGLAYHAAQCGETELAATLYMQLAHDARDRHRYVDAEELYTRALDYLPAGDPRQGHALAGRGGMRYRLQQHDDALADIRQARTLAEARGDEAEIVALLLEESTILDWLHDWPRSDALAREAEPRAQALGLPILMASADLALGRACFRDEAQPIQDTILYLSRAIQRAAELGNHDIRVMAMPLLGPALLRQDRVDEAMRCYEELFELCRRAGDDFHLAVAHLSRQILWFHSQRLDRIIADLEVAVTLGRQLGNAQFERAATFNLAECYYWFGDFGKAYELGQRARDLYLRFMSAYPTFEDHLLLARILCCQGNLEACGYIEWVEQHCQVDSLPKSAQILLTLVRMAITCLQGAPFDQEAWMALETDAETYAPYGERVEVMTTAIELLRRQGHVDAASEWLERARACASRLWDKRLHELSHALQQGMP